MIILSKNGAFNMCETFANVWANVMIIRLFQNNFFPDINDTLASFTEATYPGYVPLTYTNPWVATPANGDDFARASNIATTFTRGAGVGVQLIYGYYFQLNAAPNFPLMWSERFDDGPYTMAQPGDAIQVTPAYAQKSLFDQST